MLRQYHPQRFRYERLPNGRSAHVGTLPVGTIFRVPMRLGTNGRFRLRKYVIVAWLPRRIAGWKPGLRGHAKVHENCFVANGSWQARVRCLSDGTQAVMPDHMIRRWVDADVHHVEASRVPPGTPAACASITSRCEAKTGARSRPLGPPSVGAVHPSSPSDPRRMR